MCSVGSQRNITSDKTAQHKHCGNLKSVQKHKFRNVTYVTGMGLYKACPLNLWTQDIIVAYLYTARIT
jgi:hypothetical protein